MRICLLCTFTGNTDEAMKKTAICLSRELSKRHKVTNINANDWGSLLTKIKLSDPDIIHYIPGPSIVSFVILKVLKLLCRGSKTVISAMHPAFYGFEEACKYSPYYALSSLLKPAIRILKPDLILTQSLESEEMFARMGCRTKSMPSGVDINKFGPSSHAFKKTLRQKYGLKDKFTILHVGSVRKWRNAQVLGELQQDDTQVIVVGSTSTVKESPTYQTLTSRGCIVWINYLSNIEEVYAMSDCYVFPTVDHVGAIELPLSVLEAMASNLPVITTRFGALPKFLSKGDGLIFVDDVKDFSEALKIIKDGDVEIKTREMVLPYSWENVAKRLEQIYQEL